MKVKVNNLTGPEYPTCEVCDGAHGMPGEYQTTLSAVGQRAEVVHCASMDCCDVAAQRVRFTVRTALIHKAFEDRPDDPVTYQELEYAFKGVPAHILRSALVEWFAGCSYTGCSKRLIYQGLSGKFSPAISREVAKALYQAVAKKLAARVVQP